eukprot:CAMPEP_0179875994 /NCGR_PEP_ID=MMETSP0982-20121206/23942_1 /TAXON_ID=483367 /ORGANISM="non described non described, Strain CCMP 2436" /LENGTH=137 /DNA_ID=CAMNT_0021768341 /DNA_START=916 /DNA_END=1330 /DNA_ORIENTATION=+
MGIVVLISSNSLLLPLDYAAVVATHSPTGRGLVANSPYATGGAASASGSGCSVAGAPTPTLPKAAAKPAPALSTLLAVAFSAAFSATDSARAMAAGCALPTCRMRTSGAGSGLASRERMESSALRPNDHSKLGWYRM